MKLLFVLTLLILLATVFGCSRTETTTTPAPEEPCIKYEGYEGMQKVVLYHYTNKEGKDGILNSRKIKMSFKDPNNSDDDARFGEGTYFTELNPKNSTNVLLFNNFGSLSWDNLDKLDFFFNCSFTRNDPLLCHSREAKNYKKGTRNIWLYYTEVNIDVFNCKNDARPRSFGKRSVDRLWSASSRAKSILPKSGFLQV